MKVYLFHTLLAVIFIVSTNFVVAEEGNDVYMCKTVAKQYSGGLVGDRNYDVYGTDNPIYSHDFFVDSDMGLIHSSAYVIDSDKVKGRTQIKVRWFVAPFEDVSYNLTVYCKK